MAILSIQLGSAGTANTVPQIVNINTNDTVAAVTATGYLNNAVAEGFVFQNGSIAAVATQTSPSSTTISSGWYTVQVSGANTSLVPSTQPGDVILPTIANHIAVFKDTTGTIGEDATTAINGGNIQAGLSGTAGTLASYPATGAKGSLVIAGVANTGNTNTTISNDAMGQASTVNIPDPGNAVGQFLVGATATPLVSGNFPQNSGTAGLVVDSGLAVSAIAQTANVVLLAPAADQTISAHNLLVSQGNLQAGSSGHAGTIASYPAAASNGSLIIAGVGNAGNFNSTVSSVSTLGQASVYTLPDPGAATSNIAVTGGALVSGNFPKASGTAGVLVDSGIAFAPASGVIGVPYVATVVMNTAAVTGAYATPFQLIAAPGASLAIMVLNAQVITEVSTAFATGGVAQIQYNNTVHGGGTIATSATIAAAEITAATSQIFTMAPIAAATVMATATFKNLGLFFSNATGAFTSGSGSTVTCVITYVLVPAV